MKNAEKISRTLKLRHIKFAYLGDDFTIHYGETLNFGETSEGIPEGAKIVSIVEETVKCSMDIRTFYKESEKEVV